MCGDVATTEIRCKGRGNKIKTPAILAEAAKKLLFVNNSANCAVRNIGTHSHFAIMVIREFLIHPFMPPAYKVALEAFEGERNFVAFDLLDAAYDHHDFDGFIHYEICNIVVFDMKFCHSFACFIGLKI
jgi:hypothetical protein